MRWVPDVLGDSDDTPCNIEARDSITVGGTGFVPRPMRVLPTSGDLESGRRSEHFAASLVEKVCDAGPRSNMYRHEEYHVQE